MKKKLISGPLLLSGLIAFVVFMVVACAAYYLTAKVFITADLAVLYAVLGLLGALALVLRRRVFAAFFYAGCLLGWLTGHFVASLEGSFAPTAGVICTFFLIAAFSVIGGALEWNLWRRRRAKEKARREQQRQEDDAREQALLEQQRAAAQAPAAPVEAAPAAEEPAPPEASLSEALEEPICLK